VYLVIAGVVVWTFLFFLVFEKLGYVIATTIYLIVLTSYFNRGRWITNVVTAVVFCVGSYWMFKVLGVNLAQGILPF
jgi:putative tricarboxylic transport membrane protein